MFLLQVVLARPASLHPFAIPLIHYCVVISTKSKRKCQSEIAEKATYFFLNRFSYYFCFFSSFFIHTLTSRKSITENNNVATLEQPYPFLLLPSPILDMVLL